MNRDLWKLTHHVDPKGVAREHVLIWPDGSYALRLPFLFASTSVHFHGRAAADAAQRLVDSDPAEFVDVVPRPCEHCGCDYYGIIDDPGESVWEHAKTAARS